MPRYITVNLQCDWEDCSTVAPEGSGEVDGKTLSIDLKKPKQFLLCKEHQERFDDLVLPLMTKGITVEGKEPSTTSSRPKSYNHQGPTITCEVDGCTRSGPTGLLNRTGFAQHVVQTHGFANLAAYEEVYGRVENPAKPT